MKRSLFAAAVCGVVAAPAMAGSVVMDNTAGLAGTPGVSASNLGNYRRAIEFKTGDFQSNLDTIGIGLKTSFAGQFSGNIVMRLLQTTDNAWTGSELAIGTYATTIADTFAWYQFDVSAALGGVDLASGTNYSIVFEATGWPSGNTYTPMMSTTSSAFTNTGGFELVSTGWGGVGSTAWYADIHTPAIQIGIQQSLAPAVPGVGGLAAIAGVGLAGRRRRR